MSTSIWTGEADDRFGHRFVVIDPGRFRMRIYPDRATGRLAVGLDVALRDDQPGQMADFTPGYEHGADDCGPGDVAISDDGLLSVTSRQRLVIRWGWTAQIPAEAVEPIRRAIALAEAYAAGRDPESERAADATEAGRTPA